MTQTVFVEACDEDGIRYGIAAVSGSTEQPVGISSQRIEESLKAASDLIDIVSARLASSIPDECQLEVSIGFALESGSLVAMLGKASASSCLTVTFPARSRND